MQDTKLEFIENIVKSEWELNTAWIRESILTNPRNKNLFLVFKTKQEVIDYLYNLKL